MSIIAEGRAINKYVRMSSYKVSRILDQIRGKNYQEARLILEFMPYRSCKIIKKLMDSAVSNINDNNDTNKLVIQKAYVNKGPTLKRFQPRAQGRAFPIHKPTCHIGITVQYIS